MRYIIILCMLMISSIVYAESNIGEEKRMKNGTRSGQMVGQMIGCICEVIRW